MIKAIIFDYFGVICSDEYWNLVKVDKNVSSDFLNIANKVNLGQLHWRDFMQHIAERTGKSFEEVKSMYEKERINPEMIQLINELRGRFKIGLITNAHHEFLEPILHNAGLDRLFDSIIISSRVGHIKPDSHIFELALAELGVKPAETIFIDDIERNTLAANGLGLYGIRYSDFAQLRNDLGAFLSS